MFTLKNYQQRAVDCLERFLTNCRQLDDIQAAYHAELTEQGLPELPYRDQSLGVPYVCLRIPTGGGKTVLGSYAIDIAARCYQQVEYPVALWLVPTNIIRLQTAEALKNPQHPYRQQLDKAFNRQVMVLDIDEVTHIRPQDLGSKAIVVVSTLANLRVTDTSGRKVYAYHENFEPHFAKIPASMLAGLSLETVAAEDCQENGLSAEVVGQIKYSFANLLNIYRPTVIIDEAHNARTPLTFETLQRVNPSCIIELTATPNTSTDNGSNLLFHVSAAELKAEEMIKLPVMLTEHQNWQNAIRDAVITRNDLAKKAIQEHINSGDYIRPIALFQAEPKNGEVTVEVLKNHLLDELKIPENKIAIATGNQRELDGLNLFAPDCPIEYIITIEALKEGWDCSFAYVFASVKSVSSSKDAEQLLGRVLRMPYAKRRIHEDLNRAYAHLASTTFSRAAQDLYDKLIDMGFDAVEIGQFVQEQHPWQSDPNQPDLFSDEAHLPAPLTRAPELSIEFDRQQQPDLSTLSDSERQQVSISEQNGKTILTIRGEVGETLRQSVGKALPKKEQPRFERDIGIHNQRINAQKSPSQRGEVFGALPMVCVSVQGELELLEREVILDLHDWDLSTYPATLNNFTLNETTHSFSIDIEGKKVVYHQATENQTLALNEGFIAIKETDLIAWLDRKLQQSDIVQVQLRTFIALVVKDLIQNQRISLTALVRNKHALARAIGARIQTHRETALQQGYQQTLFQDDKAALSDVFLYQFKPESYPSRPPYYSGAYRFNKHFFPQETIEDLKASGEEFECAQAIDRLPEVKHWIRNLARRDEASFWLPLAKGKFYPDFVAELNDGRMLVVEYKGEVYISNDDSVEKCAIGDKWAEMSDGKCLFLMATKKDKQGRGVFKQIQHTIRLPEN